MKQLLYKQPMCNKLEASLLEACQVENFIYSKIIQKHPAIIIKKQQLLVWKYLPVRQITLVSLSTMAMKHRALINLLLKFREL